MRDAAEILQIGLLVQGSREAVTESGEPRAELISLRKARSWLGRSRRFMEGAVRNHPEIVYRNGERAKRYFRKQKIKEIILLEQNSNTSNEPAALFVSRRAMQKWLGVSRRFVEQVAISHPDIVYQQRQGTKRLFRKVLIRRILLGE
jgi:hypothetical protein